MKLKGITLILVILVMTVVSIAVLGIATFITNTVNFVNMERSSEQAYYAAKAGVFDAIADYENVYGGYPNACLSERWGAKDYLLVDATKASRRSENTSEDGQDETHQLTGIDFKSLRDPSVHGIVARDVTITSIKVEWSFGGTLQGIVLGGASRWTGSAATGVTAQLSPALTIGPGQFCFSGTVWEANNRWLFSTRVPNSSSVTMTFYFSTQASSQTYSRRIVILDGSGRAGNAEFCIRSEGFSTDGRTRRTLEANYDVMTKKITSWQEI